MSILKFSNGKNRGTEALRDAIDYIMNPEKTSTDLITGNGVDVKHPAQDMETVQTLYGKERGRSYIHYVISFDKDVSAELAYEIADKCAGYFRDDYQYSMAVHRDKTNKHAHVILNTVNAHSGYKFSQSKKEMLEFRDFINSILNAYGLSEIGKEDKQTLYVDQGILPDDMGYDDLFEDDMSDDYAYDISEYCEDDSESHSFRKFFFDADAEELQAIAKAEEADRIFKRIIRYFEGREEYLPDGIDYDYAEMAYEQWMDSQRWDDEYY